MNHAKFLHPLLIMTLAGFAFGCVTMDKSCSGPETVDISELKAELSLISPYLSAEGEALFLIEVFSPSGEGLSPGMLDPSCFRIQPESGAMLTPVAEGLGFAPFSLGTASSISRTLDLQKTLKGMKTQDIEVWWEYGTLKTDKIGTRVYEWDLARVEAVIETNKGEMVVSFCPDKAPGTVKNFVDLCLKGFYDGLKFHRVMPGFMVQGGCPHGDGTGDPGYNIPGEFSDFSHERGVISMARSEDPDSAGCQFFIMHQDNPGLDGLYASFGKLVSGFDTLDRLAAVETQHQRGSNEKSRPSERLEIEKIFIRPAVPLPDKMENRSPDSSGELKNK